MNRSISRTSRTPAALALALAALLGLAVPPAPAADAAPPGALARQWRLIAWQGDFSGVGLSVISIRVADAKAVLDPLPDDIRKWSRTVSDLSFTDGVLQFRVTYDTVSDDTRTRPVREDWFEGRFDPKTPDRVWGVLGPRDAGDDDRAFRNGLLRPAELNPAPAKPETMVLRDAKTGAEWAVPDSRWAMPSVLTPGLGAVQVELNARRAELENGKPIDDDRKYSSIGQFRILEEFAAARKPNRRGFHMLRLLVRNAHLASVPPEQVEGWLGEILDYAAAYGPRYVAPLRRSLAEELDASKEADYKPLAERLRSGGAFPMPAASPGR